MESVAFSTSGSRMALTLMSAGGSVSTVVKGVLARGRRFFLDRIPTGCKALSLRPIPIGALEQKDRSDFGWKRN